MRSLLNNQEGRIIKMETKLINYISMLEEEIKRIKNEWYSPNSVGDKEKYFRDHLQKYRVEIKELKAEIKEDADSFSTEVECLKAEYGGLQAENDKLKAELVTANDGINDLNDVFKDLQAESIEQIKDNERLQAEKDALREQVEDLMIDLAQAKKLRDKFGVERDDNRKNIDILKAEIKSLKADVKRHEKQYHILASSKELKAEADEYFSHNPKEEKLFFLMVGGSGCDEDGDVINTLNVGCDAIAEYDNYNGNISGNTYD